MKTDFAGMRTFILPSINAMQTSLRAKEETSRLQYIECKLRHFKPVFSLSFSHLSELHCTRVFVSHGVGQNAYKGVIPESVSKYETIILSQTQQMHHVKKNECLPLHKWYDSRRSELEKMMYCLSCWWLKHTGETEKKKKRYVASWEVGPKPQTQHWCLAFKAKYIIYGQKIFCLFGLTWGKNK